MPNKQTDHKVPNMPNWLANSRLHYMVIALLSFVLYANTLSHQFVQDDAIVITENMYTTQGFKGLSGIWNKDTFYGFFKKPGKTTLVPGGRYRPLTLILFAAEWQLFGDSPLVFHLINILLFALLAMLFYRVVLSLLAHTSEQKAKPIAFFAALLFASHPIHTEVVANIKGADEIVALFGSLLALLLTLKAYRSNSYMLLALASFIFGLTIFSKENTITFLAIIPVALYLFGHKNSKGSIGKSLLYTLPLLLAVIPFLIKRSHIIGTNGTNGTLGIGKSMELMNNPFLKIVDNKYVDFSFSERLSTIIYTLGDYIRLLIFPHPLTSDYYPHHVQMMHFSDWQVILSIFIYTGLLYLAVKSVRKNPLISMGIFIYFASLSIVSNLFFPIGTFMAERFLFMPSIGFSLVVGALLVMLAQKRNWTMAWGIFAVVILLFSVKTILRNPAWKNDDTLFLTDIKVSKESAKIQNSVGGTLLSQASKTTNPEIRKSKVTEAIKHLKLAIKAHPNYKSAWLMLGNAQLELKNHEQAIVAYKNMRRVAPDDPVASQRLTLAYRKAGMYYGQVKGDTPKAIAYLKEAEKISPNDPEVIRLLGVAYGFSRKTQQAIIYLKKALELSPKNANIALDLSLAYEQISDLAQALTYKSLALTIDPEVINKRMKK